MNQKVGKKLFNQKNLYTFANHLFDQKRTRSLPPQKFDLPKLFRKLNT